MNGEGGSYLRQADGSLKLVARTEAPKPPEAAAPEGDQKAAAAKTKKDSNNG